MRINLEVPYEEKDKARRLGASWDPARKTWYIQNKENLKPFMKWIPERLKRPVQPSKREEADPEALSHLRSIMGEL
jgi:hypothetical protein